MTMARVVITAVVVQGRTKSEVARDYGVSADQVLHAADLAMYRAKDHGKNCYEVARGEPVPERAIP